MNSRKGAESFAKVEMLFFGAPNAGYVPIVESASTKINARLIEQAKITLWSIIDILIQGLPLLAILIDNHSREQGVEIRFYFDPDTGEPHIRKHGITEQEVEEVLHGRGEDLRAARDLRRKIGQTVAGRVVQVIYVRDENPEDVFVITAYEPQTKAKTAFRRRQRRKPK